MAGSEPAPLARDARLAYPPIVISPVEGPSPGEVAVASNEKASVRAQFSAQGRRLVQALRGATLIAAATLTREQATSQMFQRRGNRHPAYLRTFVGRFLGPAARGRVRAVALRPRLSLCPGSLLEARRLLVPFIAGQGAFVT